ncbi:MAG: zf-HC2 domain-containing protein [Actinobacteria bacterium]|nr:zf-HC2 domain-containing protein [Actinomycetota bacterium]
MVLRAFGRQRGHDPEPDAASYLDGAGSRRWRQWFEAHLLHCEDCWTEVIGGRTGRSLAERARELAPTSLREDIRAEVSLAESTRRGRTSRVMLALAAVLTVAAVATALVLADFVGSPRQPEAIAAALTAYRADRTPSGTAVARAPDLSATGLRLISSGREPLNGIVADVFRYVDPSGRRVFVFLSDVTFPEASGANERAGAVHGWQAVEDDVHLVCADSPVSYLVMGDDDQLVRQAEEALRTQRLLAGAAASSRTG